MRTRSQSRRRRQQQTLPVVVENFDLEEPIVDQNIVAMADNRTMAQMLQAPIEGYEDAIVVPPINANNFELKQPLINLVQSNHFNGKNKTLTITSIFKQVTFKRLAHPEVPVPLRKSFCFSLFSRTVKPKKKVFVRQGTS
ncbi:hypothetical protein Tco_1474509 [Tanacetum coccineum]